MKLPVCEESHSPPSPKRINEEKTARQRPRIAQIAWSSPGSKPRAIPRKQLQKPFRGCCCCWTGAEAPRHAFFRALHERPSPAEVSQAPLSRLRLRLRHLHRPAAAVLKKSACFAKRSEPSDPPHALSFLPACACAPPEKQPVVAVVARRAAAAVAPRLRRS